MKNFEHPLHPCTQRRHVVSFGTIYISWPMVTEIDGSKEDLYPNEARLRNMTLVVYSLSLSLTEFTFMYYRYSAPLMMDITKRTLIFDGEEERIEDEQAHPKIFIGRVRSATMSTHCVLTLSPRSQ